MLLNIPAGHDQRWGSREAEEDAAVALAAGLGTAWAAGLELALALAALAAGLGLALLELLQGKRTAGSLQMYCISTWHRWLFQPKARLGKAAPAW